MKVLPGEYYVTSKSDEVLVTILGSCVSACIRDRITGVGGMNHFMLAQSKSGSWGSASQSTRFGNFAMEKLINELLKAGCSRSSLEIKLFGGGNVIDSSTAVGTDNAEFAVRYLEAEGCDARPKTSADSCRVASTTIQGPEGRSSSIGRQRIVGRGARKPSTRAPDVTQSRG